MAKLELLAGERQDGETVKAIQACNDFLRLGAGRTVPRLLRKYRRTPENTAPTDSLNTLEDWQRKFKWAERAEVYDAAVDLEKTALRKAVFSTGFANDYKRVQALNTLAEFTYREIRKYRLVPRLDDPNKKERVYDSVWVPDVKQMGGGEFMELIDIVRYNGPIFEVFRGLLDDIAREKGERQVKKDDDKGEPTLPREYDFSGLTDEERATFEYLLNKALPAT